MSEFSIREYRDEDLTALAIHWKETYEKKGWPPGFEFGGDFSEEAIREALMRFKYIACWLGWLDDKIVSFLSYRVSGEYPDMTYVELFNTHPDYHGMGYGRKIMTHCIDRAIRDNVKRVDLHTWSANTKAVPLYKKTGFFWRPRTSWVHMYNFLPAVINNPIVKEFLGDTWWYEALRQDLEIKENDELYNDCSYHKYVFEKDGKKIEVLVDPSTSGITGIESDDLTIRCDVPGLTHVPGIPQKVIWILKSANKNPVQIKISSDGADGIEYSVNESFELVGEKELVTEAVPSADLRPDKIDWYGKPVSCRIEVDGKQFEMCPGIRVVLPFELDSRPYPLRFQPGEEVDIVLNLESHITRDTVFMPDLSSAGDVEIIGDKLRDPIEVKAENSFGIPVRLRAGDKTGSGFLKIGGKIRIGDDETEIHPIEANVGIAPIGQPVEIPDDDPNVTAVSNGVLSLKIQRKGGEVGIHNQSTGQFYVNLKSDMIGEPFTTQLRGKDYDISVRTTSHAAEIGCRVTCDDFPGIVYERIIKIGTGSTVDVVIRLKNESGKQFNGRVRFVVNNWSISKIIIPLKDRVIQGQKDFMLGGTLPLPKDVDDYPEPWALWTAPGSPSGEKLMTGMIFEGAEQVNWQAWDPLSIEYAVENLNPGESVELPHARLMFNVGMWQDVQKEALKGEPSVLPRYACDVIHAESPVFMDDLKPSAIFNYIRPIKLAGTVMLKFGESEKEVSRVDWDFDNPIEVSLPEVKIQDGKLLAIDYSMAGKFIERTGQLPALIPSGSKAVEINEGREGDYDFFDVNNGCIGFCVSPKFNGSLFRLTGNSDPDRNLVYSSWPKPGMWTWFNPWHGGIAPDMHLGVPFYKSKFDGDTVKLRWSGYEWEGVRTTITPIRKYQGLKIESFFLTRPGYPVVLHLERFTETTGISSVIQTEGMMHPCPSGDIQKRSVTILDEFGRRLRISQSDTGTQAYGGFWVATSDPETGRTIGIVSNNAGLFLWDAAESGQAVFWSDRIRTIPGQTMEIASMIVVADKPDVIPVLSDSFKFWGRTVAEEEADKSVMARSLK